MLDLRLLTGEYDNIALMHAAIPPKVRRTPVLSPKTLRRLNAMPDKFSIKDWMRINNVDKGSAYQSCTMAEAAGYLTSATVRVLRGELIFTKTGKEVVIPEKRVSPTTISRALRLYPDLPATFHLKHVVDLAGIAKSAAHACVSVLVDKGLVKLVGGTYHKC